MVLGGGVAVGEGVTGTADGEGVGLGDGVEVLGLRGGVLTVATGVGVEELDDGAHVITTNAATARRSGAESALRDRSSPLTTAGAL